MIKEVEIIREVGTPLTEAELLTVTSALNGVIRKVNTLCQIMDRKYATDKHKGVLSEYVDPNVAEGP